MVVTRYIEQRRNESVIQCTVKKQSKVERQPACLPRRRSYGFVTQSFLAETRDEPLKMSAWEARAPAEIVSPLVTYKCLIERHVDNHNLVSLLLIFDTATPGSEYEFSPPVSMYFLYDWVARIRCYFSYLVSLLKKTGQCIHGPLSHNILLVSLRSHHLSLYFL